VGNDENAPVTLFSHFCLVTNSVTEIEVFVGWLKRKKTEISDISGFVCLLDGSWKRRREYILFTYSLDINFL
jgi:hypothetical protein